MIIDSHQHFWHYNANEYGWIDDPKLRRDFLPADLKKELAGIDGVIAVQARQSDAETRWLLELAEQHEWIKGVVGWGPSKLSHPKLKGWRHVVQSEPDGFMLGADFNRRVAQSDLVYDILIYDRQLPEAIQFVDQHPSRMFVLDHIAKPRIKDGVLEPWRTNLHKLARRWNVYCKISGMVTEADHKSWTEEQLRPYLDTVLEAFGPRRLMFGSDWPVCLSACEYRRWKRIVSQLPDPDRILGGTAVEVYKL